MTKRWWALGLLPVMAMATAAEPPASIAVMRSSVEARNVVQGLKNAFFRAEGRFSDDVTQVALPTSVGEMLPSYGFALTAPGYEAVLQAQSDDAVQLCVKYAAPTPATWLGFVDGVTRVGARVLAGGCGGSINLATPSAYPAYGYAALSLDRRYVPLPNVIPASLAVDVAGVATAAHPVGAVAVLQGVAGARSAELEIGVTNSTSLPITLAGLTSTPGFEVGTDCTDVLPQARCTITVQFNQAAVTESVAGRVTATVGEGGAGLSLTLDGRFR